MTLEEFKTLLKPREYERFFDFATIPTPDGNTLYVEIRRNGRNHEQIVDGRWNLFMCPGKFSYGDYIPDGSNHHPNLDDIDLQCLLHHYLGDDTQ